MYYIRINNKVRKISKQEVKVCITRRGREAYINLFVDSDTCLICKQIEDLLNHKEELESLIAKNILANIVERGSVDINEIVFECCRAIAKSISKREKIIVI